MIRRRRIRRMQESQDQGQPAAGQNVPEWINPETGRLAPGWRYPGGGKPPVKVG